MRRHIRALSRLMAMAALAVGTAAADGWAAEDEEDTSPGAKIILEFNATDEDLGIPGKWSRSSARTGARCFTRTGGV